MAEIPVLEDYTLLNQFLTQVRKICDMKYPLFNSWLEWVNRLTKPPEEHNVEACGLITEEMDRDVWGICIFNKRKLVH